MPTSASIAWSASPILRRDSTVDVLYESVKRTAGPSPSGSGYPASSRRRFAFDGSCSYRSPAPAAPQGPGQKKAGRGPRRSAEKMIDERGNVDYVSDRASHPRIAEARVE